MRRRDLLASSLALAAPLHAAAQTGRARVLKFVPQANLTSLDPVWTTANVTRHHGYMVYDTLYGLAEDNTAHPQMAEGHAVEDDGRRYVITLRPGLRFHDGEPVRAADAVASLARWSRRNAAGQYMAANLEEMTALDDRRLQIRLKRRQPNLIDSLASATSPVAFIMPERIARTDPFTQFREVVGSGPYRFKADEYVSGSRSVYERNADYAPAPGGPLSLTAGPKVAYFDRIEWLVIPDSATAAAALRTGEIGWYEQVVPELAASLRRDRAILVEPMGARPQPGVLRLNHLHPPFDNPALRRALWPAIDQRDFMTAIAGDDPAAIDVECGFFTSGSAMASKAGLEPLLGPRGLDRAKALMREAGYAGQPLRLLTPTDILAPSAIAQVAGDLFRRLGFNLEDATSDWGTVVQRRASREPVERGGWSAMTTAVNDTDFLDPAVHFAIRGNGLDAWFGWPTSPRLEALREEWLTAEDRAAQVRIAAEIQRQAMEDVPYIPVGAYRAMTATRRALRDRVRGFPIFWGVKEG
ncbi:ABC transporter substrate-binding protein [Roseomonas sp. KE2513]|uniref:ABC transporter substrate-binding protein n=1 Tax=Roseomonas sp. KE2513 TaxID=2479202 RepID=UPI0018DF662F|nr:ABC transporter substrate-binding protein [Roseomonas sp. KE2513]MBI0535719.1 ABC transporter substrate-binding protein [Roseomonas sp. KE2513]